MYILTDFPHDYFKISGTKFGKPWHVPSSYPTIRGTTYLNGVTFANYGDQCGNRKERKLQKPTHQRMTAQPNYNYRNNGTKMLMRNLVTKE